MINLKKMIETQYGKDLGKRIFSTIEEGIGNKEHSLKIKKRYAEIIEPSLPDEKTNEIADLVVSRQWITSRHN
ncbi:MAG: hypothetical protein ACTSPN_00600 [Promethearchaeota archaeon]